MENKQKYIEYLQEAVKNGQRNIKNEKEFIEDLEKRKEDARRSCKYFYLKLVERNKILEDELKNCLFDFSKGVKEEEIKRMQKYYMEFKEMTKKLTERCRDLEEYYNYNVKILGEKEIEQIMRDLSLEDYKAKKKFGDVELDQCNGCKNKYPSGTFTYCKCGYCEYQGGCYMLCKNCIKKGTYRSCDVCDNPICGCKDYPRCYDCVNEEDNED